MDWKVIIGAFVTLALGAGGVGAGMRASAPNDHDTIIRMEVKLQNMDEKIAESKKEAEKFREKQEKVNATQKEFNAKLDKTMDSTMNMMKVIYEKVK